MRRSQPRVDERPNGRATAGRPHFQQSGVDPERPLDRGVFVLSLDLELAWGSWQRRKYPRSAFAGGAEIAARIDELACDLDMSFTFAVVGALRGVALEELDGLDPETGIESLRPELGAFEDALPTVGMIREDPHSWLAPELVDRLLTSQAGHEIGSHTYFHAVPATREGFVADVHACRAALGDVELTSLVYPKNIVRHADSLRDAGVLTYRDRTLGAAGSVGGRFGGGAKLLHTAEQTFGRRASLADVWETSPTRMTSSAILTIRSGFRRRIPKAALRRRFLRPLEDAVRSKGIYHLWSHPWNMAIPGSDGFDLLRQVCERAANLRDRGDLEILTMRQLTERVTPP